MSTRREQLKQKNAAMVRREVIYLPKAEMEVQARGLMAGELRRASGSKYGSDMLIALGTEDPDTGTLMWDPNTLEHLEEIGRLHPVDSVVLVTAINRLSGGEELGKLAREMDAAAELSSSSSLSVSAAPSGS
jgi:hypothetical protein